VGFNELPELHKGAHDVNVHFDCALAAQDRREHHDALFREGVGE
jgi:hypothetical protein